MMLRAVLVLLLMTAGVCPLAYSQMVLSARAGLVHYTIGEVHVDGVAIKPSVTELTQLDEGQSLRTHNGRAELLLSPEGFFRTGHQTEVRLLSDDIADSKLQLIAGSALIDSRQAGTKKELVTLAYGDTVMELAAKGLYRFDANPGRPARLRVYKGQAMVRLRDESRKVKKTRAIEVGGASLAQPKRFDPDFRDELDKWNDRRSRIVARMAATAVKRKRPLSGLDSGIGRRRGSGRGGGGGNGGGGRGRVNDASNQ